MKKIISILLSFASAQAMYNSTTEINASTLQVVTAQPNYSATPEIAATYSMSQQPNEAYGRRQQAMKMHDNSKKTKPTANKIYLSKCTFDQLEALNYAINEHFLGLYKNAPLYTARHHAL